jgi:hypothetical protein
MGSTNVAGIAMGRVPAVLRSPEKSRSLRIENAYHDLVKPS